MEKQTYLGVKRVEAYLQQVRFSYLRVRHLRPLRDGRVRDIRHTSREVMCYVYAGYYRSYIGSGGAASTKTRYTERTG